MDTLIVIIIVALAGVYIFRTYYKVWKRRNASCCGCASCDLDTTSNQPTKENS
ncbi:MAG: FeoB-associated Cys-rich membrane protein [Desulfobacteraceae bacterium]